MNDLLHLCDCVLCAMRGCECIDCLCAIWCKQNKLSYCSAVVLMFRPKKKSPHRHTLKRTFSFMIAHCFLSHSCSNGFHWQKMKRFIRRKQIQLMQTTWDCCRKKKDKYHCWADIKNPHADLIQFALKRSFSI